MVQFRLSAALLHQFSSQVGHEALLLAATLPLDPAHSAATLLDSVTTTTATTLEHVGSNRCFHVATALLILLIPIYAYHGVSLLSVGYRLFHTTYILSLSHPHIIWGIRQ